MNNSEKFSLFEFSTGSDDNYMLNRNYSFNELPLISFLEFRNS